MTAINSSNLLDIAETAAEQAGSRIASIFYNEKPTIRRKYDYAGSIVTNTDVESEKII